MLSSPLYWLSKPWVNDGNTSHRGRKRNAWCTAAQIFFFRNLEKNKKLTSAENRKVFPLKLSLDSYINTRVTPTNSNHRDGLWSTAGSVGCKWSERGASQQTRPPPHNNSPWVNLSTQWCAGSLFHCGTWPSVGPGSLHWAHCPSSWGDICFQVVFTELGREQILGLPGGSVLGLNGHFSIHSP